VAEAPSRFLRKGATLISFVYVTRTGPEDFGKEHTNCLAFSHDGATQAAREALANLGFDSKPEYRVREIVVFSSGDDTNFTRRMFYVEAEMTRHNIVKERR